MLSHNVPVKPNETLPVSLLTVSVGYTLSGEAGLNITVWVPGHKRMPAAFYKDTVPGRDALLPSNAMTQSFAPLDLSGCGAN